MGSNEQRRLLARCVVAISLASVIVDVTAAPSVEALEDSAYSIKGDSSREEDLACGFPAAPATCATGPHRIDLRAGSVVVVDDFLNDRELALLRGIVDEAIVRKDPRYKLREVDVLNVSFSSVVWVPDAGLETSMLALIRRIHGNAVRTIHSGSDFKEGPWAYKGAFFPDHWVLRRYHNKGEGQRGANRLGVHADTGSYARCLSAVLFFGDQQALDGGTFRTHRCRTGCGQQYGWQYDPRNPQLEPSLMEESNLDLLAEVPYKAGRLVFFLAETLHDVTEVVQGDRDVLFIWFGCEPCLLNSIVENGHAGLMEFLVAHKADVAQVHPPSGLGPIHSAAVQGHAPVVEYLLAQDPGLVGTRAGSERSRELPLHGAAAMGHAEVVQVLASHGADIPAKNDQGLTAADYAWRYAPKGPDADVVRILEAAQLARQRGQEREEQQGLARLPAAEL